MKLPTTETFEHTE